MFQDFLRIIRKPYAHMKSLPSDLAACSRSYTPKYAFLFAGKVPLASSGFSPSPGEVHLEAFDFCLELFTTLDGSGPGPTCRAGKAP